LRPGQIPHLSERRLSQQSSWATGQERITRRAVIISPTAPRSKYLPYTQLASFIKARKLEAPTSSVASLHFQPSRPTELRQLDSLRVLKSLLHILASGLFLEWGLLRQAQETLAITFSTTPLSRKLYHRRSSQTINYG
jgi:hypothetical protein